MTENKKKKNVPVPAAAETAAETVSVARKNDSGRKKHEQLIHIAKRGGMESWKAWLIRGIAILAALFVSAGLILVLSGKNPIEVFREFIKGSFGTSNKFWFFLFNTAILLCISLAVTPAFKMRFWNLGAQGQVLMGGLGCSICMFYIKDSIPSTALIFVSLAVSLIFGMIWAVIPAVFKSVWETNETLFTLMMNYVAVQLIQFVIAKWAPNGSGVLQPFNYISKNGWLPFLAGKEYLIYVLIVAVVIVFMFIYLKYSKHGYEISVVGESRNTAKYIGINVKKVIIRTVAVSGLICGLAGFLLVESGHTISSGLDKGFGFTAVLVSWLAQFNPILMIFSSGLIVFLQRAAAQLAFSFRMDNSLSDILTGVILFFIIGSEFFINYEIHFRKHKKEVK